MDLNNLFNQLVTWLDSILLPLYSSFYVPYLYSKLPLTFKGFRKLLFLIPVLGKSQSKVESP